MKRLVACLFSLATATVAAAPTPESVATARKAAAESFVLLKNDGLLPLGKGVKVDVLPGAGVGYMACGHGSAWVYMPYCTGIADGLSNAEVDVADGNPDIAVVTITRNSSEGFDGSDPENWRLSPGERAQIEAAKAKGYRGIVVLLNVGTMVDVRELKDDPSVSAILYVGYPGMEGGNAIADVLTGRMNPSGRLSSTIAGELADYPSDATWQEARHYVPYEDDIFVGYRCFSTIPGAKEKVVYPFGYGLSYTEWKVDNVALWNCENRELSKRSHGNIGVSVRVTNVGKVAGRRSVLVYTGVEGGKADHPARELRGFAKTRVLAPGESETLTVAFPVSDLAFFDDEGIVSSGSWVVDGGEYAVYVGGDVDGAERAGSFALDERVLSTPGFKLTPGRLARRLRSDGTWSVSPVLYGDRNGSPQPVAWPEKRPGKGEIVTLRQVARGERSMDEFIDQMPVEDLLELLTGQANIVPAGNTCSIGYLPEYGATGLQTADGPVGVRLGRNPRESEPPRPEQHATAFPSTALTACSFDVELQEEYGRVLGAEAAAAGIDIHLAPGICLNRHPLCGRNFEYMGEDPCLAGLMGAAYIRGVQSKGVASTLKHFAGNNRENTRKESTDVATERALREVYLKGFEIAVRESRPKCVMTSYNAVNGQWSGANYGLVEGILRGEWGFDGLVMTDWHARSQFWQNAASGNDVRMPDDLVGHTLTGGKKQLAGMAKAGLVSPERLKESARRVLRLVMESPRFKTSLEERP